MQILRGLSFDMEEVNKFMHEKTQTRGLFRQKELETAVTYLPLLRPFREVLWYVLAGETEFRSLIDEDLFRISLTPDQQLLLWRPRYVQCEWDEKQNRSNKAITSVPDDSLLQATVNSLIDRRLAAQQELDESEDDIKRVHADRRAAVAFLIPRRPSSLKKQEKLEDERRSSHGIHLATSMIMNCPKGSIVSKGTLGRRFWVPTVMTEFRNLESGSSRLVFLESPDAASLEDAVTSGRALTRLCQLSECVSNQVHRQFSNHNSTYSPQ